MSTTEQTSDPDPNNVPETSPPVTSPFEGMNNTEMALVRTDLATQRTELAEKRTSLSIHRTDLASERNELAEVRTELARERTRAAEERTLMAWMRTSLSMISFGFGIDRFFSYINKTEAPAQFTGLSEERLLGLSLITLGVVALSGALINHWRVLRDIEKRNYTYAAGTSFGFTVGIVLLFVGAAAFIPLIVSEVQIGEIFSLDNQVIKTLVGFSIFAIMLGMGISMPPGSVRSLLQQRDLLVRGFVSVLVAYPLIAVTAIKLFDLSPRASIALLILASAPAAPLLTKRAKMAGANVAIASAFQILLAISSVVVTPLLLTALTAFFPEARGEVSTLAVAKQVAVVQLLPLGLGILGRQVANDIADEVAGLVVTIANITFLVLAFFLLAISLNLVPQFSLKTIGVYGLVVALGLVVGHVLGGPALESRAAVATATIARNAGLALFIAVANDQLAAVPAAVIYLVVGAVIALPYNLFIKRQMKPQDEPVEGAVEAAVS